MTDAAGGERLFLLDDLFGSREANEKAASSFADLRRLVERLRGDRRLIVAQVDHVLYEICRSSNLSKCSLGTHGWTPVQPLTAGKATEIWTSAASEMSLPRSTIARVEALIANNDRLRSPGALTYLAYALPDLPDTIGDETIAVFAHSDASDFARILVTKNQAIESMHVRAVCDRRTVGHLPGNQSVSECGRDIVLRPPGGDGVSEHPAAPQSTGALITAAALQVRRTASSSSGKMSAIGRSQISG